MPDLRDLRAAPNLAALFLLTMAGAACSGAASDSPSSDPAVAASPDSAMIEVPHPERFPLVQAEIREIADELHLNGVLTPEVNRSVPVLSLGGGRVVDIRVRLGDEVKQGQVLLRIESPDLAAALADYHKFQADAVLAGKQLDRSDSLYAHGVIALKDLEAARNTADKAEVDLKTAADHVHVLGGALDQPSPILEVRAPIAGTIVEQNVTGGTGVRSLDNSPNLFTIADLSRVWVLCDVFEDALARVHLRDLAEVRLNAYPDRSFQGRVGNISRVLDPSTRSAKIRIELDNPGRVLRAGMFVTVSLRAQQPVKRLVVPTSALLRLHDRDWVFRRLGGNRFRRTEVQTGPPVSDSLQQVLSGLRAHDTVVANALQFANASGTR
ncbi:MAG TPA: efflux RND transporter periplasmic adaptor subunit [Gemmatimonadales bacterium]|nr:efflux RND transporter periplasmic adaptor subunit [Gemmatimonadales bacterium]